MNSNSIRAVLALTLLSGSAAAQQSPVMVNMSDVTIASTPTMPPDVVRLSGESIFAATGYRFAFNPVVEGLGFIGALFIPDPTPLGDVLNSFVPGQQRFLYGAVRNPEGTVPVVLDNELLAGTFSGITLNLRFVQDIQADGRCRAAIRDIVKPFGLGLDVISGGAVMETFVPPPATRSEWHFTGDLMSVKDSGLAPASGPGKMRYLDDAAFGPILGGPGELTEYPSSPTPQGVTDAQSSFGTTTSFGIASIGGDEDTVYRTSPPRNAGDPGNQAKSRAIGLAVWPNTRDYWPEDRNGQWTMVFDLLIPQAAWNVAGGYALSLLQDNHNNENDADGRIRVEGGAAEFGFQQPIASDLPTAAIQPNQWFRLAIVCDSYRLLQSRIFVNGTLIGTTGAGWLYSSCKSLDPRWGDIGSTNPSGTVVVPATWNAWGQFPSPWAQSPNATAAPMASTLCLFADLLGRGESVYIANYAYTDETLSDATIAGLGGPSTRGVFWLEDEPCRADFDGINGADVPDIFLFLAAWFGGDSAANFDGLNGNDVPDIFLFLAEWFAGC